MSRKPRNPFKDVELGLTHLTRGVNPFKNSGLSNKTRRGTERKGKYKGGKRSSARLSWSKDEYSLQSLRQKSEKELRKEYSRLRSILRKRFERFDEHEGWKDTKTYRKYHKMFISLKDIKNRRELEHLLQDAAHALQLETSSVKKLEMMKKKFLETINREDSPYKGIVNSDNYIMFTKFMDAVKDAGVNTFYDSDRLLEWFRFVGISVDLKARDKLKSEFEKWASENVDNFKVYK